jgi:hypothetical protein
MAANRQPSSVRTLPVARALDRPPNGLMNQHSHTGVENCQAGRAHEPYLELQHIAGNEHGRPAHRRNGEG